MDVGTVVRVKGYLPQALRMGPKLGPGLGCCTPKRANGCAFRRRGTGCHIRHHRCRGTCAHGGRVGLEIDAREPGAGRQQVCGLGRYRGGGGAGTPRAAIACENLRAVSLRDDSLQIRVRWNAAALSLTPHA
jgi:hypothetical protein